ncbi:hypothetical protein, partial [Actinoplanes philippinensis]|uniref:hypothetical protein n=1 Tax=Actinoplanes philippinensis TaxID=35752 RepID=UPI0033E9A437
MAVPVQAGRTQRLGPVGVDGGERRGPPVTVAGDDQLGQRVDEHRDRSGWTGQPPLRRLGRRASA